MAFCGYNDTMASGIRALVEGMIEAMAARHARGIAMSDVVAAEMRDLEAMNATLMPKGSPVGLLPGLCGINLFAQVIFSKALPHSTDLTSFSDACRSHCEEFIDLVRLTEERHQQELERGEEGVRAINVVAQWLLASEEQDRAAAA